MERRPSFTTEELTPIVLSQLQTATKKKEESRRQRRENAAAAVLQGRSCSKTSDQIQNHVTEGSLWFFILRTT